MNNPFSIKVQPLKNGTAASQFVGAYLPRQLTDRLILLSILHQKSKSQIIRTALDSWGSKTNETEIIKKLANKAFLHWSKLLDSYRPSDKRCVPPPTFTKYTEELTKVLLTKGVTKERAQTIITKFEQMVRNHGKK